MRLFVLASGNAHKKEEYERLIQNAKVEVFESFKAEENGINYTENARIKLLALKKLVDEKNIKYPEDTVLFADDSGLEISSHPEILGLYTSRFCENEHLSQKEKNQRIISLMKNESNRKARFVCHIAFMFINDGIIHDVQGEIGGEIADSISGTDGFGYDPIFIPNGENKTLSALGGDYKQTNSHRYHAVCKMIEVINGMY